MMFDVDKLKEGDVITLVCEGIIKPRQEFVGLTPGGCVLHRGKLGDLRKTQLKHVHVLTKHDDDRRAGERPGMVVKRGTN